MTLFDIFYQHTEWWCNPDLGHDTQGKYGDVLKEIEDCALDYARSIKDTGDRWKRVIENETRELCRPNHYSWNLRGDKKEWHDTVVRDFLIRIRKAIEHCYGYNFTELPKSILPSYGIYCDEWPTNRKPQQKHIEAPQQPIGGNSGELAGSDNENAPESSKQPDIKKEELPTIYDDEINKVREQQVFYNAIKGGWMQLNGTTYKWLKNKEYLALMCGLLYWGDKVKDDLGAKTDDWGEYPKTLSKSKHRFKYEYGGRIKTSKNIKDLFGGVNVSNYRSQLTELPDEYGSITRLFPTD